MDKWFKDILPDKDPYHNRGRDQHEEKGGSGIRVPVTRCTVNGHFVTLDITLYISYKTTFFFFFFYCEVVSKRILIIFAPEEVEIFKDYLFISA
jgi:hypothetical protein